MTIKQVNFYNNEINLLLLCTNLNPSEEDFKQIRNFVSKSIDWPLFNKLIIENRTFIICYQNLKLVESTPYNFLISLKKQVMATGTRNIFLTLFLQELVTLFDNQHIFMFPFKGPVLAEQVYFDIIRRPFSDLDLYVNKSDAVTAFNVLKNKGLTPQLDLNAAQVKKYIENGYHFQFYHTKRNITVELHWELSGQYLARPINNTELKKHIISGSINGKAIPCLSPESLLVYLCVHGTKHGWESLEQICSVSELIKKNKTLDWKKIEEISSKWGCKRMLSLGLFLAAKLLNAPVPGDKLDEIIPDVRILKLADEVIDNLFGDRASSKKTRRITDRFSSFHLRVRESFIDNFRYGLRLMFRPTIKEWLYYPVPAPLSFVHYFLRPYRLAIARFKENG